MDLVYEREIDVSTKLVKKLNPIPCGVDQWDRCTLSSDQAITQDVFSQTGQNLKCRKT